MKTGLRQDNPFAGTFKLDHAYAWEVVARKSASGEAVYVLDYGCHDGALIRTLVESFPNVTAIGCDKNCDAVREGNRASNTGNVTLHCPEDLLEWVASQGEIFDVVLAMGVVEHVVEQERLLTALAGALKPGGSLVVSVPGQHRFSWADLGNLKFHFPRVHKFFVTRTKGSDYYHKHFVECSNGLFGDIEVGKETHEHFTKNDITRLVESAGFRKVQIDGFGSYYRLLKPFVLASPSFARDKVEAAAMRDLYRGEEAELVVEAVR